MTSFLLTAWIATALWIASLLLIAMLHVWSSDVNPIRSPFSSYGQGDGRPLYVIHGMVGVAGLLLLANLFRHAADQTLATIVPLYLALAAAARLGTVLVSAGGLRLASSAGVVAFPYLAIAAATPILAQQSPLLGKSWMALWWFVAATLAGTLLTTIRPLQPAFGLLERLFLVACESWFLAASLRFTML